MFEPDDLDDAIIEDTVHCDLCGRSWVLGGSGDGIFPTLPADHPSPDFADGCTQLKLCLDCAAFVARTYEQEARELDACPHGVITGDWCQTCHEVFRSQKEEE